MSADSVSVESLSALIARSIVQQIATARAASPSTSQTPQLLDIKGFFSDDHTSVIEFGQFDISAVANLHGIEDITDQHDISEPSLEALGHAGDLEQVSTTHRSLRRSSRPKRANVCDTSAPLKRPKTSGLRLRPAGSSRSESPEANDDGTAPIRRLQIDTRRLPQRRINREEPALRPSSLNKLLVGIWEQIFSSISFDMSVVVNEWREENSTAPQRIADGGSSTDHSSVGTSTYRHTFTKMNNLCRKITQAARCSRALEVVVQASWVEHFERQVQELAKENPHLSITKARMQAMAQACSEIGWTEKEIRNKMAIWRGYKELKDAGGWVCLVFAGMGVYRFCKYRIGFDNDAMQTLRRHRSRFEVAADTLHPHWREMLSIVDAASERVYSGHPHDWVVSDYEDPIPLRQTYLQWDPGFSFTHLDSSVVDHRAFGAMDPRLIAPQSHETAHVCTVCSEKQSDDARQNLCRCFPNLYGTTSQLPPAPVQIFRTRNGRNNGLIACCPFERGTAIGEYIGLVTKGLEDVDIMQAEAEQKYQIFQGREGNHTRFLNHSCRPNSQFQRFVWMGVQRVIVVSRGIEAGQEITVDYSDSYWRNLAKICLCGEPCCRFKDRAQRRNTASS